MDNILSTLKSIFDSLLGAILELLPTSPFTEHINNLGRLPYLGYINWFIPIGTFLKIGTGWLVAVGLFYLASVVLRWIKAIQ